MTKNLKIVSDKLHFAPKYGHIEVVIFMIMCSKLSKNPRDFIERRTPLHLAAKKVVKCLACVVDHVNAKDFDDYNTKCKH